MSPVSHRRAARRRLLTVGAVSVEGTHESIGCLGVDTIFAALGELATCAAREPIEAVVLGAASTHRIPDLLRNVEAIGRLEPSLPVIAVAPGLPLPALEGRVDLQIAPPLHINQVRALLEGESVDAPAREDDTPAPPPPPRTAGRLAGASPGSGSNDRHHPDRSPASAARAIPHAPDEGTRRTIGASRRATRRGHRRP